MRRLAGAAIVDGARGLSNVLHSRGNSGSYDPDEVQARRNRKANKNYGKQRRNAGDNKRQNKQAHDALKHARRILQREGHDVVIDKDMARNFHDVVNKKGLNYQEMVEEGLEVLKRAVK